MNEEKMRKANAAIDACDKKLDRARTQVRELEVQKKKLEQRRKRLQNEKILCAAEATGMNAEQVVAYLKQKKQEGMV